MKFSILSSSSKTNKMRGSERSSTSSESSMRDSSVSTTKTRPEFVSGSMKQMDSHDVINYLEMLASTGEQNNNDYAFECFQNLKNSEFEADNCVRKTKLSDSSRRSRKNPAA